MKVAICDGCAGSFSDIESSTHRYMESSPGCWAVFGEVITREFNDPAYFAIHRLTVDTYAVQHPGQPSPQSIKSVGIHLLRLHLFLERGFEMQRVNDAMPIINQKKKHFVWLTPPPARGSITIADVHQAVNSEQHIRSVKEWAVSVWAAWFAHHEIIRRWSSTLK